MDPAKTTGKWVGRGLLALVLLFIAVTQIRTVSEPQFWSHLASGRSLTTSSVRAARNTLSYPMSDTPIRPPEWLFDVLLYRLWTIGGAPLVTIVFAALLLGALTLAWSSDRQGTPSPASAAALVLAGWLTASQSAVNPETCTLFFAALFLWLLSRSIPLPALAAVTLLAQAVWAQCDRGFLLGPALGGLAAAEFAWERRHAGLTMDERRRLFGLIGLTVGLLLVTFLHPVRGVHAVILDGWREPWLGGFQVWISPLAPLANAGVFRWLLSLALLIAALGLALCNERLRLLTMAAALIGSFAVLRHVFFLPLFAVLGLPFMDLAFRTIAHEVRRFLRLRDSATGLGGAMAVALVAALSIFVFASGALYRHVGSLSRFGFGVEERPYASAAAVLLDREDFARRPIHLPWDGGYLAWRYPQRRVFCDMRRGVYDQEFKQSVARWASGDVALGLTLAARWNADAFVINALWPTAGEIVRAALSEGWALIYFDGVTAVLVPNQPEFRSWIESTAIGELGLRRLDEEINAFLKVRKPSRSLPPAVFGAATLFAALDQPAHAARLYDVIADHMPATPRLALVHGTALCKARRFERAIPLLEYAARRMPKQPATWLWLAQAYAGAGREADAQRALENMRRRTGSLPELSPGPSSQPPRTVE